MADAADQAEYIIEVAREAAIQYARLNPYPYLRPNGFCAWCGDPVLPDRVFCRPIDNDCEEVARLYERNHRGDPK